jgi:hypothetical protein
MSSTSAELRFQGFKVSKLQGWILIAALLTASVALSAQTPSAQSAFKKSVQEAELLQESREAGLLTDWHLQGRFGHGGEADFARRFKPEKEAAKAARRNQKTSNPIERYELVFPEGRFALPPDLAALKGVFYADSSTYLSGSGEWNVYLESGAEAMVFVDGQKVLESGPQSAGVLRGTIHAESGRHSVMVKFTAQAAPFRVAILPPTSGSRRKNNTPYLHPSPESEYLMAEQMPGFKVSRLECKTPRFDTLWPRWGAVPSRERCLGVVVALAFNL